MIIETKYGQKEVTVVPVGSAGRALEALEELKGTKYIGFDTETTGLNPVDENTSLRIVTMAYKTEDNRYTSYVFDLWKLCKDDGFDKVTELMRTILESDDSVKVGHNLKFDVKFSRYGLGVKRFGRLYDTLIASQIAEFNMIYSYRYTLKAVAHRWIGAEISKEEQDSDWSGELTKNQVLYAGLDPVVPLLIRDIQVQFLLNHNLIETAKLEFECIDPVASLELNGIKLDTNKWLSNAESNSKKRFDLASGLYSALAPDVRTLFPDEGIPTLNLNSPIQVARAMKHLGIDLPLTEKGELSANKKFLTRIKDRYPVVTDYIAYSELKTSVTRYGAKYLKHVNRSTGRVHSDFFQIGAPTARFSCRNPNLQQIPRGSNFRACFVAEEGWTLVDADYSQMELRILAEFCKDAKFSEAFLAGHDFHTATASTVFDVDIEDVTTDQRTLAKNLNFGIVYGVSAKSFSELAGITEERAEDIIEAYFEAFPRMKRWLEAVGSRTRVTGRSWTGIGRIVEYEFDRSDRKKRGEIERNGKNTPIQGTSADILKRALRYLHEEICHRDDIRLVNIVHDEIIVEARLEVQDEAEEILTRTMIRAGQDFLKTIPVKVDCHSGLYWSK